MEALGLEGRTITEISSDIGKLENLTMLWLTDTSITDIGFAKNIDNLEVLFIKGSPIEDLSVLLELENLDMMGIEQNVYDANLTTIAKLENKGVYILIY